MSKKKVNKVKVKQFNANNSGLSGLLNKVHKLADGQPPPAAN